MGLDYRHRVARVGHLRKNNQLHASIPGATREVLNLEQVGFWITERTRNLSGRDLHLDPPTKHRTITAARAVRLCLGSNRASYSVTSRRSNPRGCSRF